MSQTQRDFFYAMFDYAQTLIGEEETLLASFYSEVSSFVRFNQGKIRQPGTVNQSELNLELVQGARHLSADFTLSQNESNDKETIRQTIESLRENIASVPEDPHFLYATEVHSSENIETGALPSAQALTEQILDAGEGLDFVGILAHGSISFGFANSLGQRNWFKRDNFNFDWSVYSHADKAIKSGYSGFEWNPEVLKSKFQDVLMHAVTIM